MLEPATREEEIDETAAEIMKLVDGVISINSIVDKLHQKFSAATRDQISKDVISMLQSLADKGFVLND